MMHRTMSSNTSEHSLLRSETIFQETVPLFINGLRSTIEHQPFHTINRATSVRVSMYSL
jgi:hypothetical protein